MNGNWSGGPYGLIKFGFRVRKPPKKLGQSPTWSDFFITCHQNGKNRHFSSDTDPDFPDLDLEFVGSGDRDPDKFEFPDPDPEK